MKERAVSLSLSLSLNLADVTFCVIMGNFAGSGIGSLGAGKMERSLPLSICT